MSEVHLSTPSKTPAQSAKIRSADVVVVGGGITGKACALGLAQLGLNTIEIAPDLGQAQIPLLLAQLFLEKKITRK
jgi:2-octaprenylphenol hydroxylase